MKESLRAKRMAKHHRRLGAVPKLNLVSLMDIFTILVFFLLFNSSDVEVLSSDKNFRLPESVSTQKPDTTLLIKVNNEDLLVGNRPIAKVPEVLAVQSDTIAELAEELQYQANRRPMNEIEQEKGRAVTIMGDQDVPYQLLKRIMQTAAANEYRDISLSVAQIVGGAGQGAAN